MFTDYAGASSAVMSKKSKHHEAAVAAAAEADPDGTLARTIARDGGDSGHGVRSRGRGNKRAHPGSRAM